jgi:preprotein translocase subunit SecF
MSLALFGGEVIRPFALVMFFGILLGTFSSIFIASPVLLLIEKRWPGAQARGLRHAAAPPVPASGSRRPQPAR